MDTACFSFSDLSDSQDKKKPDGSPADDTIHYLSPVSAITLQDEENVQYAYPPSSFLRYLQKDHGEDKSSLDTSNLSYQIEDVERTIAIIKPDAIEFEDVVVRKILSIGLKIIAKRKLHMTPEQVLELYSHHYGQTSFPYIVVSMSRGPCIVMCLAGINAVAKWKEVVGIEGTLQNLWFCPRSMRHKFGIRESLEEVLHASQDIVNANREVRYFFPRSILEPLIAEEKLVGDYLNVKVNPTLLNGLTEACKRKPIEPILFLADWLLQNNPYQPKFKEEIARLPT